MKTIILIFTLAIAAAGQGSYLLCTNLDGSPLSPAFSQTLNVANGDALHYDIVMPVAGRCVGAFTAYDASDDLNRTAANVLGKWVDRPKGDIEVLIMDEMQFALWLKGRSNAAFYQSRPQLSGRFAVDLPIGNYKLVLSNRHSKFAPKTVDLILGQLRRKRPAAKQTKQYRAP